jgi:hypothetical protein
VSSPVGRRKDISFALTGDSRKYYEILSFLEVYPFKVKGVTLPENAAQ